jgi:uncharacterized membrane protein YfcA
MSDNISNISILISDISREILNPFIRLLVALAIVYFLFGVFKFMRADDEKMRLEGRNHMLWGIVGIFIMIGVWGIISVIMTTFDI